MALPLTWSLINDINVLHSFHLRTQGRIQDFKLGGTHLKKMRRAEAGAKILGVFRVKNHDFTPKNHIFFNFRGARAGCAPPPPDPPLGPVCQFPLGQIMKTYKLTSKTDLNVLFFHCQLL